ncbi:MAG TPA: LysM domain-containing protein [Patescibacteria group bacterium]|nr:LysM domain-containing protein [Patescibacteria group bacterium]
MPKKVAKRVRTEKQSASQNTSRSFLDYIRSGESYTSLILGIVVVIITSILLISFFKNQGASEREQEQQISSDRTVNEDGAVTVKPSEGTHTVALGETLWSIAEKQYKSGYAWVDIAKANNLTDPNQIEKGMKLKLPDVKVVVQALPSPKPTVSPVAVSTNKITGETYKVQRGDYLWSIAVRRYGDGYKWVEIAKANNIATPDVIYADTSLKLPNF